MVEFYSTKRTWPEYSITFEPSDKSFGIRPELTIRFGRRSWKWFFGKFED